MGVGRKPRADAVQNRERLIEAAKEILGQGGPSASLEAVARQAGVGTGTLYRHFPTREDLFQAVYHREVEQMLTLAADLESRNDKLEAVRSWLHAYVGLVATKRGLLGTLAFTVSDSSKTMYEQLSVKTTEAVGSLLQAAISAGEVRGDVTADDLLKTLFALCYAREPAPGWESDVLRLLDIFIDGLRVQ
ncbi:TetR family transcriptional regulator [Rhodobacterales bacterium HKCCE3408]|nr:TetR family transcriptional regulator [Rhodobacterales bacterium HKCCE3408]